MLSALQAARVLVRTAFYLSCTVATATQAAENSRAYRYTDGDGKVVYSQAPPVNGQPSDVVNIRPAQSGRGGVVMPYNEPLYRSSFRNSTNTINTASAASTVNTVREQQLAALRAQCVANRGTDCNDPRALQYLQSTQLDRKSTRLNSSHVSESRMPSSA